MYVNGQDITGLRLGWLDQDYVWVHQPEYLSLSPEKYLAGIQAWLRRHHLSRVDIQGLAVAQGPGSATALRTSHALVNALAFALQVPVWSVAPLEGMSDADLIGYLQSRTSQTYAWPRYTQNPKITHSGRDQLKRKLQLT